MGAWIETSHSLGDTKFKHVAPRVGAWIEKSGDYAHYTVTLKSPPAWGAWIEKFHIPDSLEYFPSPPAWGARIENAKISSKKIMHVPSSPAWGARIEIWILWNPGRWSPRSPSASVRGLKC